MSAATAKKNGTSAVIASLFLMNTKRLIILVMTKAFQADMLACPECDSEDLEDYQEGEDYDKA